MPEYLEGDERASADGPVPSKTNYSDWLARQSETVQREILGPARYAAYKNGMKISSFVSGTDILTLKQLMKKEGLGYFDSAVKDGSWQVKKAYADVKRETKQE
jgi:hypothetical protein